MGGGLFVCTYVSRSVAGNTSNLSKCNTRNLKAYACVPTVGVPVAQVARPAAGAVAAEDGPEVPEVGFGVADHRRGVLHVAAWAQLHGGTQLWIRSRRRGSGVRKRYDPQAVGCLYLRAADERPQLREPRGQPLVRGVGRHRGAERHQHQPQRHRHAAKAAAPINT